MGRKCSTVYDNRSCKSVYKTDNSGFRVLQFPDDEERKKWLKNLPNVLKLDYEYKIGKGGFKRPLDPPTEFGNTPKSLSRQTTTQNRSVDERRISSDERAKVSASSVINPDIIRSWDDFCRYCEELGPNLHILAHILENSVQNN